MKILLMYFVFFFSGLDIALSDDTLDKVIFYPVGQPINVKVLSYREIAGGEKPVNEVLNSWTTSDDTQSTSCNMLVGVSETGIIAIWNVPVLEDNTTFGSNICLTGIRHLKSDYVDK